MRIFVDDDEVAIGKGGNGGIGLRSGHPTGTAVFAEIDLLLADRGKSSPSTARPRDELMRAPSRQPLHMVSAWAARQRVVLAQEAVDEKSNEIVAIPLLLERLQLTGALVTIDAMGTQTDIAERIVAGGGDYLLALKANRPVLHQDVVDFFANPPADMTEPGHHTTDADHGRIEERRHVACHKVDWLFTDRRYPGEPRFPIWR